MTGDWCAADPHTPKLGVHFFRKEHGSNGKRHNIILTASCGKLFKQRVKVAALGPWVATWKTCLACVKAIGTTPAK